ncbi:RNA-directed DNA polymerase, eukaryota [Tanacetum coccineum]
MVYGLHLESLPWLRAQQKLANHDRITFYHIPRGFNPLSINIVTQPSLSSQAITGGNERIGGIEELEAESYESVLGIDNQPPTPTKHQRHHPSNVTKVTNQPPIQHTMNGGNEEAGGIEDCIIMGLETYGNFVRLMARLLMFSLPIVCLKLVGRYHLHANAVRYEHLSKPHQTSRFPHYNDHSPPGSYAAIVKDYKTKNNPSNSSPNTPALVLEDSCSVVLDLSRHVMGKVKDLNSIPNLLTLLFKEGFLGSSCHISVVKHDFVSDGRVVWVDIEGIPLHVWSRDTFMKIGSKWGVTMDIEENLVSSFAQSDYVSDDESFHGANNKSGGLRQEGVDLVDDSDEEGVSETIFGDKTSSPRNSAHKSEDYVAVQQPEDSHYSEDPFGVYELLYKKTKGGVVYPEPGVIDSEPSISHPLGFTPEASQHENNHNPIPIKKPVHVPVTEKKKSPCVQSKAMSSSQENIDKATPTGESSFIKPFHNGGSILEVLDDMIRVGQSMGYDMQGLEHKTKKEWVQELNTKHKIIFLAIQETKLDCISYMDVKFIWGNSNYLFVSSDSMGSSGGILCVWEASIFRKDYATVSDNFIGIYGTWLPSNTKVLFVAVYAAPSSSSHLKVVLWCIFRLDCSLEGARSFNHFISSSGLVDVKMEGYSFTWSHPSASKMSKLDRFLVSEGIISLFPSLTALCLDHHLLDHRPILLNEIHTDYGPVPFRVYHSWFKREGFDDMVKLAWNSFSHSDSNQLIKFKKKLQDLRVIIRGWIKDKKSQFSETKNAIIKDLIGIDKYLDNGIVSDELLLYRMELTTKLQEHKQIEAKDFAQKAKIKWAIEGDKNSIFFHGIINKRRSQLAIRDLERVITRDEIRAAVWGCGENKSPGPDGGMFPKGNNASFIALIPKVTDAKFVTDFRPISLIGSVYKVVTKILANRLSLVILDLVSDTQSAFVANRQILDGPFIMNELLAWCKRKRKQALIFKVDFAKAYDSVRWDYLLDVLHAFGFGPNWCKWIRGTFTSAMASILVNGSPTTEFPFFHGLKQGDPLAPFLFILVMESLHLSVSRAVSEGVFKGIQLHGSMSISHIFYADDAVFIGEWSDAKYLGMSVGDQMSRNSAWANTIQKLHSWLSRWKVKTLSVGGRLTLLKSVLGASPLYNLSIYKAPKGVLHDMESIRSTFFNGADPSERKITWVAWEKVLASKKNGGLEVSSFHALNRALLLKWVWRFLSQDGSIWSRVISAIYGPSLEHHQVNHSSSWCSILRETRLLASKGFDFVSHCKKRVGDGQNTRFWSDTWISDLPLCVRFPRLFALEEDKEVSVASKLGSSSVDSSFRRLIRDGIERQQWSDLSSLLESVILSPSKDRWFCDLNGEGAFRVKDARSIIDDIFLPSSEVATRWVKYIPIKINIFMWRARLDRIPTRCNLASRGVVLESSLCPLCGLAPEDTSHVLFRSDSKSDVGLCTESEKHVSFVVEAHEVVSDCETNGFLDVDVCILAITDGHSTDVVMKKYEQIWCGNCETEDTVAFSLETTRATKHTVRVDHYFYQYMFHLMPDGAPQLQAIGDNSRSSIKGLDLTIEETNGSDSDDGDDESESVGLCGSWRSDTRLGVCEPIGGTHVKHIERV